MRNFGFGAWVLGLGGLAMVAACGGKQGDEPRAAPASGGQGGDASDGGGGGERPGAAGATGTAGAAGAAGAAVSPCAASDPALAEADAEELFGAATIPAFDLYLPADEWEALQVNARDEQFVAAEACFEGRSIGRVGLRFKGSFGSLYNCFDESGVNICRKLSMKIKFSEFDPERRLFGLKRLNFHGYRYDSTYLKERLAYDVFRAAGIVAPRAAWALLRVNDDPQGLFGMVEEIDGRFTADRWPDHPDQNLYKETWPIRTDEAWVTERLKTNEETADVSAFIAFSQAMLDTDETDGAALRETLGAYTDLDYFARYMAVDDAIASYDGVTAYYTSEDAAWAGNHNFYLYEEAPDHFTLIPWDLESSMLPDTGFGDVPRWTEAPDDCSLQYPAWGGENLVIAPGCDRVFRALAADLDAYRAAGDELLAGAFSEAALLGAIDEHAAFIRDEAVADPHGPGATTFESDLVYLKSQVPILRQRFEALLAGETVQGIKLSSTAVNDLEEQSDFGLLVGTFYGSNPNSTMSVAVNTTSPLAGARDLVMSFEYANEEESWQQWSYYQVPLAGAPVDLSSMTGIRMLVRSDQSRTLRFNLDSMAETARMEGIRLGWDVPLTDEPTEVEVLLADAAVQAWAIDQGSDPGDDPAAIIRSVTGLVFEPQCIGRGDTSGQLPEGTTDAGFFEVDEIEFF